MTRIADADFRLLEEFVSNYKIPAGLGAQARSGLLKRAHRHVLSGLQVWQRVGNGMSAGSFRLSGFPVLMESEATGFLAEYFSDIVGSLSCALNGLYKPANILLRSSIENLVRGLAGVTSTEAIQTTSVYKLFEIAAAEPLLSGQSALHFRGLHQLYGDLCLFVHSGSAAHRDAAHELAQHLRQDTSKLRQYVGRLERVNRAGISLLVLANPLLYTSLHHRARDLLDDVLPSDIRLTALGA